MLVSADNAEAAPPPALSAAGATQDKDQKGKSKGDRQGQSGEADDIACNNKQQEQNKSNELDKLDSPINYFAASIGAFINYPPELSMYYGIEAYYDFDLATNIATGERAMKDVKLFKGGCIDGIDYTTNSVWGFFYGATTLYKTIKALGSWGAVFEPVALGGAAIVAAEALAIAGTGSCFAGGIDAIVNDHFGVDPIENINGYARELFHIPKVEENLPFSQTWSNTLELVTDKCSLEPIKIYNNCISGSISMTDSSGYLTTAAIPIIRNYINKGGHTGAAKIVLGEMVYGCIAESISNTLSQCASNRVEIEINNDQVNAIGNIDGVD